MLENSILVIENDPLLTKSLQNHCRYSGLQAEFTSNIATALEKLETHGYSLVVVDRKLDDGDGLEVVEYFHDTCPQTKVIICSQLGSVKERIYGLSSGADAYLPKPFSFKEFSLILNKLLHMHKKIATHVLSAGDMHLDLSTGSVQIASTTYKIRKKEAELLACLLIHKDAVVSRMSLLEYVWGIHTQLPTYNTLDVYIRRIRMQLGKENTHRIKTVRGFGYMVSSK